MKPTPSAHSNPAHRGSGDRIAPGIYKAYRHGKLRGYRVFVRVQDRRESNGRLLTKRFPPATLLSTMKQWREDQRSLARRLPVKLPDEPATGFAKDAETYLAAVKGMITHHERTTDIADWVRVFGDTPRSAITSAMIRTQLAIWRQTKAASTVNHRRTALMHLWRVLDGRSAANPVKDVPPFREPDPLPRGLPYPLVRQLLAAMPSTKNQARAAVMAWTGLPPKQIEQLQPGDIDWTRQTLVVRGRGKGTGTPARTLPLTADAIAALKTFAQRKAWGHFSRAGLWHAFQLACRAVEAAAKKKRQRVHLADATVYDLRHSFLTQVYAASGDIRATQLLAGHSSPKMTARYTLGAVEGRLHTVLQQFTAATKRRKVG